MIAVPVAPLSHPSCHLLIHVVLLVAKVQQAVLWVHAFVYVLPKYTQGFQARHVHPQARKDALWHEGSEDGQDIQRLDFNPRGNDYAASRVS